MAFDNLRGTLTEKFLTVASTACWFNSTFDYRTVAIWCEMTEEQATLIRDRLVEFGFVEILPDGASRLTDTGRLQSRRAA
jgi:hypothetical protein